jgi:hypothetical protein
VTQSATQLERVFHEEPERVERRKAGGHNVPPVSLPSSSFTSPLNTPRFRSADDILDAALHSAGSKEEKLAAVEKAMQEVRELLQKDADAARMAVQVAEERQRRETEAAEQRAAAIREMLSAPEPTEPPTREEPAEGEEYLADLMRGVGARRAERKKARAEERRNSNSRRGGSRRRRRRRKEQGRRGRTRQPERRLQRRRKQLMQQLQRNREQERRLMQLQLRNKGQKRQLIRQQGRQQMQLLLRLQGRQLMQLLLKLQGGS